MKIWHILYVAYIEKAIKMKARRSLLCGMFPKSATPWEFIYQTLSTWNVTRFNTFTVHTNKAAAIIVRKAIIANPYRSKYSLQVDHTKVQNY